ncbi:MAG: ribonuclease domain-containing protein, partial [Patescibacteria group bacterium]
ETNAKVYGLHVALGDGCGLFHSTCLTLNLPGVTVGILSFWKLERMIRESIQSFKEAFFAGLTKILSISKGGTMFVSGFAYQVVDSSLFNIASTTSRLFGYDINSLESLEFQLGRETGNNTIQYVSVLAIVGGGGTFTMGAAGVTASAICMAYSLPAIPTGVGVVTLGSCTATLASSAILTGVGAITAGYGATTYSLSEQNQTEIHNAVTKVKNQVLSTNKNGGTIPGKKITDTTENAKNSMKDLESTGFDPVKYEKLGYHNKGSGNITHENRKGFLPQLPQNKSYKYLEWDTFKTKVDALRGKERFVTLHDHQGKLIKVYYTDTHYGDLPGTAFFVVE